MTEHATEPWEVTEGAGGLFVASRDDSDHQYRDELEPLADMAGLTSRDRANARRIIAAVNACAEIPTETLEQFGVGGLKKAVENAWRIGRRSR